MAIFLYRNRYGNTDVGKRTEYLGIEIPYFDTVEGRASYLSDHGFEKEPGHGSGHNKWKNPELVRLAEKYGIQMPQKFATEGARLKPGYINNCTSPATGTWANTCMQIIWLEQEVARHDREARLSAAASTTPQQLREREAYMRAYGYMLDEDGKTWVNKNHQALIRATNIPFLIADYNANLPVAERINMISAPGTVTNLDDSTKWDAIRKKVEAAQTISVLVEMDERSQAQKSVAWHARKVSDDWRKTAKRRALKGESVEAAPASVHQAMALNAAVPHGGNSSARKEALQRATQNILTAR